MGCVCIIDEFEKMFKLEEFEEKVQGNSTGTSKSRSSGTYLEYLLWLFTDMVAETNARIDGPTNSNSSRPNLRNKSVESGSRETTTLHHLTKAN